MNNDKEIRYLNRDFQSTLKKLVDYTKYYYPDSFNDFSPASPAMIILQLISYVGDVLNFYIDRQTKESLLYYATKKQSIYNIAQTYGYRIKTGIPSAVPLQFQILLPLLSGNPDFRYAPILLPGTVVYSSQVPNSTFTVLNTINFKQITKQDQVLPVKVTSNNYVIIRKKVYGYSVIQKTHQVALGDSIKNNIKIYLPDKNIAKISSVKDSNGNDWYQVLNLANDTVLSYQIQYKNKIRALKRIKTNKRYKKVVDSQDKTFLYFGAKQKTSNLSSQLYQSFYKYDSNQLATPSMLLLNNNYGQVPFNTTLTIKYLVSNNSSVSSNIVNNISKYTQYNSQYPNFTIYNQSVLPSLTVTNSQPSSGGYGIQSLQSIKQNALATMNSQQRLVTKQDYQIAINLMPAQYGSIYRSFVKKDNLNNKVQLYVLSCNNQKKLCKTVTQVKQNLGQYLSKYRMLGDFLSIKDAFIINVGCQFSIVVQNGYSKKELLVKSMKVINQFMNIQNYQIGSYIDLNQLRNKLLRVQGVINVPKLLFFNKKGGNYSSVQYQMSNALHESKYFPSQSPSIFQLKYPELDIVGSVL